MSSLAELGEISKAREDHERKRGMYAAGATGSALGAGLAARGLTSTGGEEAGQRLFHTKADTKRLINAQKKDLAAGGWGDTLHSEPKKVAGKLYRAKGKYGAPSVWGNPAKSKVWTGNYLKRGGLVGAGIVGTGALGAKAIQEHKRSRA